MARRENPALVVDHGSQELKQVRGGGSPRKTFAELTPALRQRKANEWKAASDDSLAAAEEFGLSTGVLKVKLRSKAIAKSHRPQYLLQQAGRARIIGAGQIGTLLVAVQPQSAVATHDAFLKNTTQDGEADLTTIESIQPYSAADRRGVEDPPAAYQHGAVITLFDFRDDEVNAAADTSVTALLQHQNLEPKTRPRRRLLIKNVTQTQLDELARHPAVRRIWPNSAVSAPAVLTVGDGAATIPPPQGDGYPTVGVLDDGVSPDVAALVPWIEAGPR